MGNPESRPPVPGPIGAVLSRIYRPVIARINRRFDAGRGVVRFDRPVISVGNLSVGGTGKTPMVRHLIWMLLADDHRPCIAMRGYKKGDGESDEAAAYRREFPDVPVIAQANRTDGLIALFGEEHETDGPHRDCIVLDDGFQHRQIARDLDIVLVDASRNPFDDKLLPAGWLREPVDSLKRAGLVIVTHAESIPPAQLRDLESQISKVRGSGPEAVTRHAWEGLDVHDGPDRSSKEVSWLRGKRVLAVCAIGNPTPFLAEAGKHATLAGSIALRDHDAYAAPTVQRIVNTAREANAGAILVTAKDWAKLESVRPETWPCPIAVARLELTFERGETALRAAVEQALEQGAAERD